MPIVQGEALEPAATLASGAQVAGYVVEERIGIGGFGEVYRARQPVIGREVAIKVLHAKYSADPDAVARFVAEARAVNQISHAGIVEVFDFGRLEDGREFCVMELIAGRSLRAVLNERKRLPLVEALPILRGIAAAVDAAHAAGIAHRDLKPDNVFVTTDGRTKLIDFGLAKLTREHDAPATRSGSFLGTPLYMSPEQCRGKAIDTRTDVYSFGALAYHVMTGEPPFSGEAIELALHHLNDRPEPPSRRCAELPHRVDRVVLALLAKDPADRPTSLATAMAALDGSITLRRRWSRRAKRSALALLPLGVAAFAVVKLASREAPAADSCVLGSDRLAGIWDPAIGDTLEKRFTALDLPDVVISWRLLRSKLDETATRWATQWDEACHAPDRTTEMLLYGARLTCLENARLDLHMFVDSLSNVDVKHWGYAGEFDLGTGGRTLGDCANPAVLRAQVPAPAPAVRDRVAALLLDYSRASTIVWTAQQSRKTAEVDRTVGRLDTIINELEAIDPPSAAMPIIDRADVMMRVAADVDAQRFRVARAGLEAAIHRVEASRDDVAIAYAQLVLAAYELESGDPDALVRTSEAAARAELAVVRAGRPYQPSLTLARLRGDIALARGQFDLAIASYREALRIAEQNHATGASPRQGDPMRMLSVALARSGQAAEAIVAARRSLARDVAMFGDASELVSRLPLAHVLQQNGDLEGSLAVLEIARASQERGRDARHRVGLEDPPYILVWTRAYMLEIELRLGRAIDPAEATAAIRNLATLGIAATPPLQNADGIAVARRAGLFAVFVFGTERAGITDADRLADHAATLAFERGDYEAMAKHAAITSRRCATPHACADWIPLSRWLAILADAKAGHAPKLGDQLAALEAEYANNGAAVANSGIVLATLGRWSDARKKLETARAKPNVWEHQADLAELDTWLALARIQADEPAIARQLLEDALFDMSITRDGIDGFSYTTPIANLALARLLWATNAAGDRSRARLLAERARDGFAWLGKLREPERQQAIRWLDEHRT
jgi:predicted Ser/Thr protein kinase/tetratricopeptide (TPR) repeat protein